MMGEVIYKRTFVIFNYAFFDWSTNHDIHEMSYTITATN